LDAHVFRPPKKLPRPSTWKKKKKKEKEIKKEKKE